MPLRPFCVGGDLFGSSIDSNCSSNCSRSTTLPAAPCGRYAEVGHPEPARGPVSLLCRHNTQARRRHGSFVYLLSPFVHSNVFGLGLGSYPPRLRPLLAEARWAAASFLGGWVHLNAVKTMMREIKCSHDSHGSACGVRDLRRVSLRVELLFNTTS